MPDKHFVIDPTRCLGCRACETACRNEFSLPVGESWRRVKEIDPQIGEEGFFYFLSLSCNHCENPECFRVCPERTYYKRRDGIVVHNAKRCTGCCNCVRACPFHVPTYSIATGKVDKCSCCTHLLDRGLLPACIEACPTKAIRLENDATKSESLLLALPGFDNVRLTKPLTRFSLSNSKDSCWKELKDDWAAISQRNK